MEIFHKTSNMTEFVTINYNDNVCLYTTVKLVLDHLSESSDTKKGQYFSCPCDLSIDETEISWLYDDNISYYCDLYHKSTVKDRRKISSNLLKGIELLPTYIKYYIVLEDIRMFSRGGDNEYIVIYDNIDRMVTDDHPSNLKDIKDILTAMKNAVG